TGDQGGAELGAVLDDLEEIATLFDRGRREQEVVEAEQRHPLDLIEQTPVATVAATEGEVVEQPRGTDVEGAVTLTDCGMGQGAADEALAAAGGAGQEQVLVGAHPAGLGQAQDHRAVETAGRAEVDVLHERLVAEVGGLEPCRQPATLTPGQLTV